MNARAIAFGVRQAQLDVERAAFFRESRPWGFVLFREACQNPAQIRGLIAALQEAVGREAMIWIDQEGGRVARLASPIWPSFPAPGAYAQVHETDPEAALTAIELGHRLIADELRRLNIAGDFAPVLDLAIEGADPIIGDRALGREPAAIAALARAALHGLAQGGIVGCIKHIPGHGRAGADSHLALPRISADRATLALDFAAFQALAAEAPAAMTAHVLYEALDPAAPATLSPTIIQTIIRGEIGFAGLLFSDDIDMKALAGPLSERARTAITAGCDIVLQCSGALPDMVEAAAGAPFLDGPALERALKVEALAAQPPLAFDAGKGWKRFNALMNA